MSSSKIEKTKASLLSVIDEIDAIFNDETIPFIHNQKEWFDQKKWYYLKKEAFLRGDSTEETFYNQLQSLNAFFIQTMEMDPKVLFYFENEQLNNPAYNGTPIALTPEAHVKYCGSCGENLRSGVKFCEMCGAKVYRIETGSVKLGGTPTRTIYSQDRLQIENKGIHSAWVVAIILFPIVGFLVFFGYLFSSRTRAAGQAFGVTIFSIVFNAVLTVLLFGT